MRDISVVVPAADGSEVRISLHPISIALIVAELIEEAAYRRCRRRGHGAAVAGWCGRCGTHLPDTSAEDYRVSYHPGVIRSWGPRPAPQEADRG